MNKEYFKLIKDITTCDNLDNLKELVVKANQFIKENGLKKDSEEFKKLVKVVELIKFKLKSERKFHSESTTNKKYIVSEEQYLRMIEILEVNSRSQEVIDDILDQISQHGKESLSPTQLKKLEDFGQGNEVDYDRKKYRDTPNLRFESKLEGIPSITFVYREMVETDMGYEYLGEVEFLDNVYTGFLVVDNDNKVQSLEFENLDTKKDLWEDSEGIEREIVSFFEGVAEGLNDYEDTEY
jgi:hypothetical protein